MYYYNMMNYRFPFMFLFWVALIGLVVWVILKITQSPLHLQSISSHIQTPDSIDILKKRYASGEITKKEYDQIKKDLKD